VNNILEDQRDALEARIARLRRIEEAAIDISRRTYVDD